MLLLLSRSPLLCTDGTSCDDTLYCTTGDVCVNGACSGSSMMCPTTEEQCMEPICDETNNVCTFGPKTDGTPCSTGVGGRCVTEMCMSGKCEVTNRTDCSGSSDACNTGKCDEVSGKCIQEPIAGG